MKLRKLKRFCVAVRAGFENASINRVHNSGTSFGMSKFPTGCCGDTSTILTHLIYLQFGVIPKYRVGTYKSYLIYDRRLKTNNTHSWLELKNLKIDLTADQFNGCGFGNKKVMITKSNKFHRLFASRDSSMDNSFQNHLNVHNEFLHSTTYVLNYLQGQGWDFPFLQT